MGHRPSSHEGFQEGAPTTSSSRDASTHQARNQSLWRLGINPSTWDRQSSDQSASQGESSYSYQDRLRAENEDKNKKRKLKSELSDINLELDREKSQKSQLSLKLSNTKRRLESAIPAEESAYQEKKRITQKYLRLSTKESQKESQKESLKKANHVFNEKRKEKEKLTREIQEIGNDLKKKTIYINEIEKRKKKITDEINSIKRNRQLQKFTCERLYDFMEENQFGGKEQMMALEIVAKMRGQEDINFVFLEDEEGYKEIMDLINNEFKNWQKRKSKET